MNSIDKSILAHIVKVVRVMLFLIEYISDRLALHSQNIKHMAVLNKVRVIELGFRYKEKKSFNQRFK